MGYVLTLRSVISDSRLPVPSHCPDLLFHRQLQQQQAELEVHQRDGLSSYDLSQVNFFSVWPLEN